MATPFFVQFENIYAVPTLHYTMESAAQVCRVFHHVQPDAVAVELPETMQLQHLHAASRLPDISIVHAYNQEGDPFYYLCEPCDAAYEGLRCAAEKEMHAYCIDLDVDGYPDMRDFLPDPYSITYIGLKEYYEAYKRHPRSSTPLDEKREQHMARRLKELSLQHDKVLFVCGMHHLESILHMLKQHHFPIEKPAPRTEVQLSTLTEESCRNVLSEYGWVSKHYEAWRSSPSAPFPDKHYLIYQLYKQSALHYKKRTGNEFPGYHLRNLMKFTRNYAQITSALIPDLYQILAAAKGCVEHNYAYEVWELATEYPHRKNVDGLPELDLSIEEIWGDSKIIQFHLKEKSRKFDFNQRHKKSISKHEFRPPGPFSICSYQPEDIIIENFGEFLKKKGKQLVLEEGSRTVPFSTSIEDGVDTRETIRHWAEKKLYVKVSGRPPGGVGSIVVIFDEDKPEEGVPYIEKYPWKTTWLGEHNQESDMALYATPTSDNVVGPGISRCEYGGFMMSYPPRRMYNVWNDADYSECRSKSEVLLVAAIDYAVDPLVVYVASSPPRSQIKSFAKRFGKKVVYIPIGQLSPITLNKIRVFHVLDGHDKRKTAGEYIY